MPLSQKSRGAGAIQLNQVQLHTTHACYWRNGNRTVTREKTERRKDLHPLERKSLIHMVRLAGIEPTTPWFVAKYSIQLSYSREALNYSDTFW